MDVYCDECAHENTIDADMLPAGETYELICEVCGNPIVFEVVHETYDPYEDDEL